MFQGTKAVKTIFYLNVGIFALLSILELIGLSVTKYFCAWSWDTKSFIPYQLITYQFLHGGFLHLLFNMLALVSLAPLVENYLGERKFYLYYLLCGIISAVLHIQMVGGIFPLVGASGSIWGITAMFALLHPNEKLNIMLIPIHFKAKHLISILFGIELFFCIFASQGSISHWGHVGGALTGGVLFLIEKYFYKNAN